MSGKEQFFPNLQISWVSSLNINKVLDTNKETNVIIYMEV
jgi:hypothetical protein